MGIKMTLKTLKVEKSIDTCGLVCPLPIIKTSEAIKEIPVGAVLEVLATDEVITIDMPAWCHSTANEYLGLEREQNYLRVYVRKQKE